MLLLVSQDQAGTGMMRYRNVKLDVEELPVTVKVVESIE